MARRIVDAGYQTTLWARRPSALDPYLDTAAVVAASPRELAQGSDLVCLCVVGGDDVREVVTGPHGVLGGLQSGAVIAIHSTVQPDVCRELAATAAKQGVAVIDAPVSGGAPAVAEKRLLVMVGGDASEVARCRPVFETYANTVVHLGDVGSGQVGKILNNLLFTANLGVAASLFVLGEALGVTSDHLSEVLSVGSANSFALNKMGTEGNLDRLATLAGSLLQKDVRLAVALASQYDAEIGTVFHAADAALMQMGQEH
jgi:3-hydroxyisobutyrate dehydrogenase-like beta-hydroxyacid dehydrogenase